MADFTALKTAIQNAIKQNGNEEITGNILQDVLLAIVSTLGDGSINDLITALGSEATTRSQADGTLQQNIDAEAQARQLADSTLQGGINTAMQAINAINNAIANGCVYAGIATPSSTPASGKVFYLALTAGTYTNYGGLEVPQGINILKNNGSTWSLDSFLGIDDAPIPSSNNLVKSGGVFNDIMTNGSAFDLSAYNNGTTYADLNAALTALNALPAAYKKGGMSMKYVQTSDNKYVQYRLMSDSFNTTVVNWQGVDDVPTVGSDSLVTSGGVFTSNYDTNVKLANTKIEIEGKSTIQLVASQLDCELPISIKAGEYYNFSLADFPNSDINFYYTQGGNVIKKFSTTVKQFYFKATQTVDKLYCTCYATKKVYDIEVFTYKALENQYEELRESYKQVTGESILPFQTQLSGIITNPFYYPFKSGVLYTIDLDESEKTAGGIINVYTGSDYNTGLLGNIGRLGLPPVVFKPIKDLSALYITAYGADRIVHIHIKDNNTLEERVDRLEKQKKAVILDTDWGGDQDDIAAVAILHWAERSGLVDIVGICQSVMKSGVVDNVEWNVISALDAYCSYLGIDNMMFGIDKYHKYTGIDGSSYAPVAFNYPHTMQSIYAAYDPAQFYRKALTSLPEGRKVDICIVGFLTNFSLFLDSQPDSVSPLTGVEIMEEKINKVWVVGGGYPTGEVETNLAGSPPPYQSRYCTKATANVLAKCTKPIYFSLLNAKWAGKLWDDNDTWSMLYQLENAFCNNWEGRGYSSKEEMWKDRYCPDGEMVLAMCEDNLALSGFVAVQGTQTINTDDFSDKDNYGKNTFTPNSTGNHYYLVRRGGKDAIWMKNRLEAITDEKYWNGIKDDSCRLPRATFRQTTVSKKVTLIKNGDVALTATFVKGVHYIISLSQNPPSIINFYRYQRDYSSSSLFGTMNTNNNVVDFVPYEDMSAIYISTYADSTAIEQTFSILAEFPEY